MVRTAGVNLAWQTGHDRELLAAACEGADVVFVCEALTLNAEGPLHLATLLPVGWAAFQDTSTAAKAGSAVCWRTSTMAVDGPGELFPGSPAGGGTRARHIASQRLRERATGDSRPYVAFHAPKRSTGLQGEFYASLDRYAASHPRAVLGGDCNRPPLEVASQLGRRAVHSEVMGIFHPANVPARALPPQDVAWSDHPIIRAALTLPTTTPPKETSMQLVTRAQWGARPRGATTASHPIGATKGITAHWEGPKMGTFTHDKCAGKVRGIEAFHRDSRGWADIAYNAIVCPHGFVFEGRGPGVKSAANGSTQANDDWYAVCYLGGEGDPFTELGKKAFLDAFGWLDDKGDAGPGRNGHRDHKATACPGPVIYQWVSALKDGARSAVAAAPKITDADMTRLAGAIRNARLVAQEVHEKDPTETYVLGIHRQLRAPFDAAAAKSSQF